jgi:hypothetical protein
MTSYCRSKPGAETRPKSLLITSDVDDGRYPISVPVYNCATSPIRHTTIGTVVTTAKDLAYEVLFFLMVLFQVKFKIFFSKKVPLNDCIWYPSGQVTTNRLRHIITVMFMQILPACLIDALLTLRGDKPR